MADTEDALAVNVARKLLGHDIELHEWPREDIEHALDVVFGNVGDTLEPESATAPEPDSPALRSLPSGAPRRIDELFLELELITEEELAEALTEQRCTDSRLGEILVASGAISEQGLLAVIADHFKPPARGPVGTSRTRKSPRSSPSRWRADDLVRDISGEQYVRTAKLALRESDPDNSATESSPRRPPSAPWSPAALQLLVVPDAQPKTEPKACNYGMLQADGEYVVIFDTEDKPEPDQQPTDTCACVTPRTMASPTPRQSKATGIAPSPPPTTAATFADPGPRLLSSPATAVEGPGAPPPLLKGRVSWTRCLLVPALESRIDGFALKR